MVPKCLGPKRLGAKMSWCQNVWKIYLDKVKCLVNFGDLDLIFKVTMRHKLKYPSKLMAVCTKPMEPDSEFCLDFYGQDIGDVLFASVTTRRKMPNANLCLNCSKSSALDSLSKVKAMCTSLSGLVHMGCTLSTFSLAYLYYWHKAKHILGQILSYTREVLSEDLTIDPLQCHLRRQTAYELKIGETEKKKKLEMCPKSRDVPTSCLE